MQIPVYESETVAPVSLQGPRASRMNTLKHRPRGFFLLVVSVAILFAVDVYAAATGPEKLSCPKNDKIRALVKTAWYDKDYPAAFAEFMKQPTTSACYLIKELHVMPETWIRAGDVPKHPKTWHVIWSVRALRYITGGEIPVFFL